MKRFLRHKALSLLTVISLLLALLPGCSKFEYSPYVTTADIKIENYSPSISNTRTKNTQSDGIAYSNGKLFLYFYQTPGWNSLMPLQEKIARKRYDYEDYYRTLVCIENGKINTIEKHVCGLYGSYGDYVYFCWVDVDNGHDHYVCAYNARTNTVDRICKLRYCRVNLWGHDFTPDGVLRLFDSGNATLAYHIKENEVLGLFETKLSSETIQLGGNTYIIDGSRIYCNKKDMTEDITDQFPFSKSGNLQFHPVGDGVAVETSYSYNCQFAAYIKSNGEVVSLQPESECDQSRHTLCVYGDYVFISFQRLTTKSFLNEPVPYKDDDISGTYRIDVRDFSRTKISDEYYEIMYIFDDTGIFVGRYGRTYKIDFDGNPLLTIVE